MAKTIHAIAEQRGEPERRLARFLYSTSVAAARLPWSLADQTAEPQVNRALDALSPFDVKSRARLRITVSEALEQQCPLGEKETAMRKYSMTLSFVALTVLTLRSTVGSAVWLVSAVMVLVFRYHF